MFHAKHFPEWEKMTVLEIREYLRQRQSVLLALGIIEQHGYHLPVCSDALIAHGLLLRVGRKLGMLVAPAVNMGFSGGALPGTINVRPAVAGLLVSEVVSSLATQGFKNIFMVLGHGGGEHRHAIQDTLDQLLRSGPLFDDVMLVLAPVWKLAPEWDQAIAEGDFHAGWLETSLIMALAPDLVQMDQLKMDAPAFVADVRANPNNFLCARKPVEHKFVVPRLAQRAELQVGVVGDPTRASRELGERIVTEMVDQCCDLFVRLETERSRDYRAVVWAPEPVNL